MTYEQSNQIFNNTVDEMKTTYLSKGVEYSIDIVDDRFHHFKLMLVLLRQSTEGKLVIARLILNLRAKQDVCIDELINCLDNPERLSDSKKTIEYINEKFKDNLIYTILLKMLCVAAYCLNGNE